MKQGNEEEGEGAIRKLQHFKAQRTNQVQTWPPQVPSRLAGWTEPVMG